MRSGSGSFEMSDERHEKRGDQGQPFPYERRKEDHFVEFLGQITQKLDDHIEQNNREFESLNKKMEPVMDFYDKAKFPVRAFICTLIALLLAIITAIGNWIFEVCRKHF